MEASITIEDTASQALAKAKLGVDQREQLHNEVAVTVEELVARHIGQRATRPNKLGAPSTGFWGRVKDSVVGRADATAAMVSIPERGFALHYFGGTVRAKNKPWLTIPIDERAHGKSVAEVGVPVYRFLSKRGNWILAEDPTGGRRSGNSNRKPRTGPARYRGGASLYALKKQVTIRADKSVIPTEAEIAKAASGATDSYLKEVLS